MPLNAPWTAVEESLETLQDFDLGAQRLSDFFKGKEDRHGPDELLEIFFQGRPPRKTVERLLFFLFDIGVPDRQTGSRALQMHRIKRLWKRIGAGCALTDDEHALADRTEWLFSRDPETVEAALAAARQSLRRVMDGETLPQGDRDTLVNLIRAEAEGLRDRVNWLSENTDPYNLQTMARILPRLRIYDEAVHEGLDLAKRQEEGAPVGLKVLSFEAHMKEDAFVKWLDRIGKRESLARLAGLIRAQRVKKIPTLDLIALSTLCRWTFEAAGKASGPLDWLEKAMDSYRDGEFIVNAGDAARLLQPALGGSGAKMNGSTIIGNFGVKTFPAWVGRDLLTKSFLKGMDEGTLDIKAVINQNITRDSLLESLLANPKVYQRPGLVAFIAATSRSVGLLSKIAKTRSLNSGFANRDVPLALLQSPCNIPISLLKPFINVRNVPLVDLKQLARSRSGIRSQVRDEANAYLESRS